MAQFAVNNTSIENIISAVKAGEIAIPEIQRPFVWNSTKVRDLIDSLYNGFPVGYITVWKNPDVKLKDGTISIGKKILIDGQQRITAIQAAIVGQKVLNSSYEEKRIKIAFNPMDKEKNFEVNNTAIEKDAKWIGDISIVFDPAFDAWNFVENYCAVNEIPDKKSIINDKINRLKKIETIPIGVTELSHDLKIEDVTEIFIRINDKGMQLSQADFAMSKIAADDKYGGPEIRKTIDYFCHFMQNPSDFKKIEQNDIQFAASDAFKKIKWSAHEQEEIYEPNYKDVLRVAFTHVFNRGKISDLVSLLSGRDFKSHTYNEEIAEESFCKLREGVEAYVNESNFNRFIMILKSAGLIDARLTGSQNAINFGYILYLFLKNQKMQAAKIEDIVRRWVVMSLLTERYTSSPESVIDRDIKRFESGSAMEILKATEESDLPDSFWTYTLPMRLDTSSTASPYFHVFLMAQVKGGAHGFLSKDITVQTLLEQKGDLHHVFPKKYLQKHGYGTKKEYNQIANYVYTQSEININIKDNAPCDYMDKMKLQAAGDGSYFGSINTEYDLEHNLEENCLPEIFMDMDANDYLKFLEERRILMASYMKKYYKSLVVN